MCVPSSPLTPATNSRRYLVEEGLASHFLECIKRQAEYRRASHITSSIRTMKVFVLAVLIGVVAAMPQDAAKPPVEIITSESEGPNLDGSYKFKFETADGVKREEEGAQKQIGEESGATSRGSWSYTAPEGDKIELTFVADENGFQPQGAHLPVAPEPSPAIKRALAIIARTNAADEARAAGMSTKQKLQMLGLLDQRLGLNRK